MVVASWILVALALTGVIAAVVHRVELRRTRGGQRLAETLHLNARWWQKDATRQGELLYVALGDSAAQGVGASNPGRSYVGLIARHLRNQTGRTVQVANLSVSGARLSDALRTQLPQLRALRPDIVTVAVGANDMPQFEPQRFEIELRTLFAKLPLRTIVADLPSFYLGRAERNTRAANLILRRLAAEFQFEVAPLYATTRRQGVARYALNQVAADFFHPNDRGYRVWFAAFLPLIEAHLARSLPPTDDSGHA